MKKLIVLGMMLLALTGCGSKEAQELDMKGASDALSEKYGNMKDMDTSELEVIYGLNFDLIESAEIKSSTLSNGNFYALIKVNDENKKEVEKQMDNLFSVLEKQSNLYSPEAVKLIQNHLSTSVGNYLIYIVSDDNEAYYDEVKKFVS